MVIEKYFSLRFAVRCSSVLKIYCKAAAKWSIESLATLTLWVQVDTKHVQHMTILDSNLHSCLSFLLMRQE